MDLVKGGVGMLFLTQFCHYWRMGGCVIGTAVNERGCSTRASSCSEELRGSIYTQLHFDQLQDLV